MDKTNAYIVTTPEYVIRTTTTTVVQPRNVAFSDILDSVAVETDVAMDGEHPWNCCEGYQHEVIPENKWSYHEGMRDSRASVWFCRGTHYIDVEPDGGLYEWYRTRGASKQVAAEMVALDVRRRVDVLVGWYRDGWEWWRVSGEFLGYSDSVGGVDDYEYASTFWRSEVALNIAWKMQKDGYLISGMEKTQRDEKASLRYPDGLSLFSWVD